jgi:hypothetical protein
MGNDGARIMAQLLHYRRELSFVETFPDVRLRAGQEKFRGALVGGKSSVGVRRNTMTLGAMTHRSAFFFLVPDVDIESRYTSKL